MSLGSGESCEPVVSVVITCYNQANYVGDAIASVRAQTVHDWEAIVVDDGSTDDTKAVVCNLEDPRLRYFFQENSGVSVARNAGIMASHGKYLAFLDGDDSWHPEFLEYCLAELELDPRAAGVYSLVQYMDQDGLPLPEVVGRFVKTEVLRERIWEGGQFALNAAVVRRDIAEGVGMFDANLQTLNDWDFWIRVTRLHDLRFVPKVLANYRVMPQSKSTRSDQRFADHITVLAKYLGPQESDPESWSSLKRRAYAYAYRAGAIGSLGRGDADTAWRLLKQGALLWPEILIRPTTYYEIACADQPRGYRGLVHLPDVSAKGREIEAQLKNIFLDSPKRLSSQSHKAYANAYYALAMLSYQTELWKEAKSYILRALQNDPSLIGSSGAIRLLTKLGLGVRLSGVARSIVKCLGM